MIKVTGAIDWPLVETDMNEWKELLIGGGNCDQRCTGTDKEAEKAAGIKGKEEEKKK